MQRYGNGVDDDDLDGLELLYDRYPIRLPLMLISVALLIIVVVLLFGNGPIVAFAGCAVGLLFVGMVMLGYGLCIWLMRHRKWTPPMCPSCGATEVDGTVYMAIPLPGTEQQIMACSHCEVTWKTELRRDYSSRLVGYEERNALLFVWTTNCLMNL